MTPPAQRIRELFGSAYAIDRELGRGGMATLYLAQDAKHDRMVALKVLHPELAASLGPERFLREIKVAARPYVDGESLRQRLDRQRQLSIDEAIHIAESVSLALDCAVA